MPIKKVVHGTSVTCKKCECIHKDSYNELSRRKTLERKVGETPVVFDAFL
jgi:hypothetical protein